MRESTADDLLRQAGLAMHQAKNNGRNSLRFFDPAMQTLVVERAYLENFAARSTGEKAVCPVLPGPGLTAPDRSLVLKPWLCWQIPGTRSGLSGILHSSGRSSGLILPLGRWVIETACSQLARWSFQPGNSCLTIAVNVSTRQFRHPDFVSEVLMLLRQPCRPAPLETRTHREHAGRKRRRHR